MTQPKPKWMLEAIDEVIDETLDWASEFLTEEFGVQMPDRSVLQSELRQRFNALAVEVDPNKYEADLAQMTEEFGQDEVDHQMSLLVKRANKEGA